MYFDKNRNINNNQMSDKQITTLVKKVSKIMMIPDEKPVIANINQAEELMKEQDFYVGSKNGDYLIVFTGAKKAIIYREDENKIINVGPVVMDQEKPNTTETKEIKETVDKELKSTTTKTVTKEKVE